VEWVGEPVVSKGVVERRFDVPRNARTVPGILWTPEGATGDRPLVLIGHGASGHKRYPYVLALARRLVRAHGFAAAAIDGPVQGDRRSDPDADDLTVFDDFRVAWTDDPTMTDEIVADWRATLDALQAVDGVGAGAVGYWGISMGTLLGLPFVASEPRVGATVLGLAAAVGPTKARLAADAPNVTCPTLFVVQWDDELFARDRAVQLFDALGSADKRLHAHPGKHIEVPPEAFADSIAFLARSLSN
jgi:dienelactone hydrolase